MADKLKRIEVEEKLKSLGALVFTPLEFAGFFGVPPKRATNFISTNLKSSLFIKLRNNFYMIKDSSPSHYFIANKLYEPSYVSLETALSHYGIIPEVVYAITSVTTKVSREYKTPLGMFSYQRIKKQVFTGYSLKEDDGQKVFLADPEKALTDYLYFVDLKKVSLSDRLELKNINKAKLAKYARLYKRRSMLKLIDQIYVEYRKPRKIY
jgi:predicted transcriptional regulator of viral defense system